MFKSKLQELCQRKGWLLPKYQTSKGGSDHEPRFLAQVDVNGQKFSSPGDARSSKHAQNEAARTALNHFLAPSLHLPPAAASAPPLPSISLTMQAATLPTIDATHVGISSPDKLLKKSEIDTAKTVQNISIIGGEVHAKEALPVASDSSNQIAKLIAAESFLNTHFQGFVTSTIPEEIPKPDETTERSSKRRIQDQSNEIGSNDNSRSKVPTTWKTSLQEHCQRNKNTLPVYTCERSGPDHCSRFTCKVYVNGQTYASESHFPSVKEAESDAARVALMSMPSTEAKIDDTNYKNLLQELTQKSRSIFPVYTHCTTGSPHNLTFVSTVSIGDRSFTGEGFKTKKAADMSAAKVAYKVLKGSKEKTEVKKEAEESKSCLSNVVSYVQNSVQPKMGGSICENGNLEVNSHIKALLEKNPLCRKGVVVYPKELGVSFPNGRVDSFADDKWIIANFKPQ